MKLSTNVPTYSNGSIVVSLTEWMQTSSMSSTKSGTWQPNTFLVRLLVGSSGQCDQKKIAKCLSIKVAQKRFHKKNKIFDTFKKLPKNVGDLGK